MEGILPGAGGGTGDAAGVVRVARVVGAELLPSSSLRENSRWTTACFEACCYSSMPSSAKLDLWGGFFLQGCVS